MSKGLIPTMTEFDSYVILFTISAISYFALEMLYVKYKEGWFYDIKFKVLQWMQKLH